MDDFLKIVLRCIVHYNCKRKLSSVTYTQDMIDNKVRPYPFELWNYGKGAQGANLISVDHKTLLMTMLPRTKGEFSRKGLCVNSLRYKQDGYTEYYLKGGQCVVAYNPEDVSTVWLIDGGNYNKFDLIESRYSHKTLDQVVEMQQQIKELTNINDDIALQSEIDLQQHITAIGDTAKHIKQSASKVIESV